MEDKFVLLICESTTGIVLDDSLNYSLKGGEEFYFSSLSDCKEFISKFNGVENVYFSVFNSKKELVYEKDYPPQIETQKQKTKWWQVWRKFFP